MAWTEPKTWASEPLVAGDMNTHIRDNLLALKDPPSDNNDFSVGGISTSSTTFTNVDTTYASSTITTHGGDVLVVCNVNISSTVANTDIDLDLTIDGVRQGGSLGLTRARIDTAFTRFSFTLVHLATGLAAGSHTFTLQWKTSAGVINVDANSYGLWLAREVS